MRALVLSLVVLAIAGCPAIARDGLPKSVRKGADYDKVRSAIVKAGYKPTPEAEDRESFCGTGADARCETYPEASSCAGTGLAPCRMVWSKGRGALIIFTQGETPIISGIEQQR